jgi:hypothetical protein
MSSSTRPATLPRVDLFLDRVRALPAASLVAVLSRYTTLETASYDPGILALMDVATATGREREIDEVVDAAYTVALDLAQRLGAEIVPILDALVCASVALALSDRVPDVHRALYEPFAQEIPLGFLTDDPSAVSVRFAGAA